MKRFRAVLTAVAAIAALTLAATAAHASPPLTTNLDHGSTTAEAASTTLPSQSNEPPAPGPSMALLGIGISSLITFRRFRKLFN